MTSVSHPHNLISLNSSESNVNLNHFPLQHHYNPAHTAELTRKDNSNYSFDSSQASSSLSTNTQETSGNKTILNSNKKNPSISWKKERFKKIIKYNNESSTPKEDQVESPVQIVPPSSTNIRLLDNKHKTSLSKQGDIANDYEEEWAYEENSENDNESTCNECHGGGELVCCDGCIKAYHTDCLTPSRRPRIDSQTDWFCPDCQYNLSLIRKSKSNFQNGQICPTQINVSSNSQTMTLPLPPSPDLTCIDPNYHDFTSTDAKKYHQANANNSQINGTNSPLDKKTTHSSPNSYSLGGIRSHSAQTDRAQSSSIIHASKDESLLPNAFSETKQINKKKKKPIDEGPPESNKINLGTKHQVQSYPVFFLNRDLNHEQLSSIEKLPTQHNSQKAELLYSPFCLDKAKTERIRTDEGSKAIKNDQELEDFVQNCAKNWRNNAGWHPFSPEFAFKILHHYGYDPQKALEALCDSHFQFFRICDPPTRKYENKWRPKDKRSTRLLNPFPPAINVRGYHSRRQNNSSSMYRKNYASF